MEKIVVYTLIVLYNRPIELIAGILGILYLYLEVKASIWLWVVGILLPIFYVYISIQSKVYGNIFVNVFYLISSIYGLFVWLKNRKDSSEIIKEEIRFLPKRLQVRMIAIIIIVCLALYIFLSYLFEDSDPFNAISAGLSFVGVWLLAHKYIENWYCFILSNIVFAVLYFRSTYYISSVLFIIYFAMSIYGCIHWIKLYRKTKRNAAYMQ